MMLFSTLRFMYLGWVDDHFIQSKIQFKYYGFEWVQYPGTFGIYALHILLLISTLGILLGAWYRGSALLFFCCFTYIELIDLTYYLNHYYFVSLVGCLLIFVPANRRFSVDVFRNPEIASLHTPRWTILIFQFQLAIVYTYAGLAKINDTWLVEALPLRIWLPANDTLPLIGPLLALKWMPWVFSWAGMLYDCSIVFWLAWARTRAWAYASVVFFHVLTGMMFQIGVFPLVMMAATWIYFSSAFHDKILTMAERYLPKPQRTFVPEKTNESAYSGLKMSILALFFAFQLLFPWRYLCYPGNLFWTEQGYRFSWRVMLMEKAGTATFYVKDSQTGREGVVNNGDFLCAHQEKQMAMQPDLILQYAHFLKKHYEKIGVHNPSVRVESYVTLNAQPSRLFIDPGLDLTQIRDGWSHKTWILD